MDGALIMNKSEDGISSTSKRRAAVIEDGRGNAAFTVLPYGGEPSFLELAVELRKLTKGRKRTPAEVLQNEGRKQR